MNEINMPINLQFLIKQNLLELNLIKENFSDFKMEEKGDFVELKYTDIMKNKINRTVHISNIVKYCDEVINTLPNNVQNKLKRTYIL